MEGINIIYWINLERAINRREYMSKIFENHIWNKNIPTKRITAIDGTVENAQKYISVESVNITNLEYACTASHLQTIHEYSLTDYPYALILEDDVSLDFAKYWEGKWGYFKELMANAPVDWEVLQLSYITFDKLPFVDYEPEPCKKGLCGSCAYIIRLSGAKRIIKEIYDTEKSKYNLGNWPVHQADKYIYTKLKTYCCKYPPFTYRTQNDSYIHPDHIDSHIISKNKTEALWETYMRESGGRWWWCGLCIFFVIGKYLLEITFLRDFQYFYK